MNLKRIPELSGWTCEPGGGLRLGACTPMRDLETSAAVGERFPSIVEALRVVGSLQLRNIASVGGNLCNASPSADTAPPLMVLGAAASLRTPEARRETVPVEGFFEGPGASVLGTGGLLLAVGGAGAGAALGRRLRAVHAALRHGHRPSPVAAAAVTLDAAGGRIEAVRIALGAVAPTPVRVSKAEELVLGKEPAPKLLEWAGAAAMEECRPIDDIRGSAAYRKELIRILVQRVLRQAVERARAQANDGTETV